MRKPLLTLCAFCVALLFACSAQAQIIKTIAGIGPSFTTGGPHGSYSGDGGPATAAGLYYPMGVAADRWGNIYIADTYDQRIRKIDAAGIITTVAGSGSIGFSGDGGPATAAKLKSPTQVAVDNAGNLYIADSYNNRIRKVDTAGIITTIAGKDTAAYSGDGGPATAAALNGPQGVAVDNAGNVYISDGANDLVRKVDTAGIITTVAGVYSTNTPLGDGSAATAGCLFDAAQIAVDSRGNIYIADVQHQRVRKVSATGVITTFAGNGTNIFSGNGWPATAAGIMGPVGVAVDTAGNVYLCDAGDARVRMVDTAGIITTLAGNGGGDFAGDGGPAAAAMLASTVSVATDLAGNVYVADMTDNRVLEIMLAAESVAPLPAYAAGIALYPNPATTAITITAGGSIGHIAISNVLGQQVYEQSGNTRQVQIPVAHLPPGIYLIKINGADVRRFVKE